MSPEKRKTRLLYGSYILLAGAFIVSCVVQVWAALFSQEPRKVSGACAEGIEALALAVELEAPQKAEAWARKADVDRACDADPNGASALAALSRYDRAASRHVRGDLARVRRGALSFIR